MDVAKSAKILVVGSVLPSTADFAQAHGLGVSTLYDGTEICSAVSHTSLADCRDLKDRLSQFHRIYWAQSSIKEFNSYTEYFETLNLLKWHNHYHHNVIGVDRVDPYNIHLRLPRVVNTENHAVFFGCSHTQGMGLDHEEQNYINIVSNHFNKSALNLAEAAMGNFRSFAKFQDLDFYKNQIVILQLTDVARLVIFETDSDLPAKERQLYELSRNHVAVFNDKQLLYMMLDKIQMLVKFARNAQLRLVFFSLGGNPDLDHDPEKNLLRSSIDFYLMDYAEYIPGILAKNVDRGNDNMHFGPRSHRIWAEEIIVHLNKLYT
jgi:hypothetical protein